MMEAPDCAGIGVGAVAFAGAFAVAFVVAFAGVFANPFVWAIASATSCAMARAGQLPNLSGIGSPYEPPTAPQATIDSAAISVAKAVKQLLALLEL